MHCDRVMHICASKLTTIRSDNSLMPGQPQAIIWTNVGIWSIVPFGTYFSEIIIEIHGTNFLIQENTFEKCWPFCFSLNVKENVPALWMAICAMVVSLIMRVHSFPIMHHIALFNSLAHGDAIWLKKKSNFLSGNGLIPECAKPSPEAMLTSWCGANTFICDDFFKRYFSNQALKWFGIFLKFYSYLPEANE